MAPLRRISKLSRSAWLFQRLFWFKRGPWFHLGPSDQPPDDSVNPAEREAHRYFNDITGAGQAGTSNGLFLVTTGYDEAPGIETPKMALLIAGSF